MPVMVMVCAVPSSGSWLGHTVAMVGAALLTVTFTVIFCAFADAPPNARVIFPV